MKTPVIMLVDDEESIINSLRGSLEDDGYIVLTASDGIKAVEIIRSQPVDIVFLDIWLPGMDGLETLKAVKDFNSSIEVIMMTGHGTVNTAVEAVKHGAFDFLEKPFSLDAVTDSVKKIKKKQQKESSINKSDETTATTDAHHLVLEGESSAIEHVRQVVSECAAADENILITGESGTGKEDIAHIIHDKWKKTVRLQKVNCAYCNENELVTALFADTHDESAEAHPFSAPVDAMLYLHSVDMLSEKLQLKIADTLSAMRNAERKGPRVIATARHGANADQKGSGLLENLSACFDRTVNLPPLRMRRSDIPQLLVRYLKYFTDEYGFRLKKIEDDAVEILINYDWPGNVMELKNLVEKLIVSVPTLSIASHDIPASMRDELNFNIGRMYERYGSMDEAEDAWRKNYILYHLRKHNRNIRQTARKLNIREKSLKRYIKDYNIILTGNQDASKMLQRTLKRSMVLSGRGLHSGDKAGLILTPMPPNTGIIFGNISTGETIPARIEYVVSTDYATCLQNANAVARTTEHLLAALHAYRITNLMIKLNNEVPIMDGSSSDFCQIIEDAGIDEQDETIDEIVIDKDYMLGEVSRRNKYITVEPSDVFSIHYMLHYPKPVGRQEYSFVLNDVEDFKREIAPARTFGFLRDIEALTKKGLADGGRLNNFILIDDEKIVNTDLRFPDEFVRHKILDMMGDLYLLGRPIRAKITANMTGHSENTELVRLLQDTSLFSPVCSV